MAIAPKKSIASPTTLSAQQTPRALAQTKRTLNRWGIFGLLALAALIVIVYVNNTLAINRLVAEIDQLKKERDRSVHMNEKLRSEIIRLQSAERITTIAREKLGMSTATVPPEKIK